ncbi:Ribosome association toxin RatA [Gammaproteobacteria bacterium]
MSENGRMIKLSRSALTPYTAHEMYTLVADVAVYPEFLPWCASGQVSKYSDDEVRATIQLSYFGVEQVFTTNNRMQPDKRIEMHLAEGPFRRLEGVWRFGALGTQGCKVSLSLEYEFSNSLLALVIGPVFNPIADHLVDAFHKRARAIYGVR